MRKSRARLIDTLLPALRIDLPASGTLDPRTLFESRPSACWLEIGYGAGEHLAWQAAAHPDIGLLGVEVFVNGVASLLRHVEDQGLDNVRLFDEDARLLLPRLANGSIERLFLLHPDPWPKYRHAARRFVQQETVREFARLIPAGGELRIATDHPVYLGWTLRVMADQPWFDWTAIRAADWLQRPADWPQTRYEAKAVREGRRCTYLRYRRNGTPVD